MFTNRKINRIAILGMCAFMLPFAARAGDYTNYTEWETVAMLDAINQDHPVNFGSVNQAGAYLSYSDDETVAMLDSINADRPVGFGSVDLSASAYTSYTEDQVLAMLDSINSDHRAAAPAYFGNGQGMSATAAASMVQAPAQYYGADDDMASSTAAEFNG